TGPRGRGGTGAASRRTAIVSALGAALAVARAVAPWPRVPGDSVAGAAPPDAALPGGATAGAACMAAGKGTWAGLPVFAPAGIPGMAGCAAGSPVPGEPLAGEPVGGVRVGGGVGGGAGGAVAGVVVAGAGGSGLAAGLLVT